MYFLYILFYMYILYLSISQYTTYIYIYIYIYIYRMSDGLNALQEALENREFAQISTDDLVKLAKVVFENNYFEFN